MRREAERARRAVIGVSLTVIIERGGGGDDAMPGCYCPPYVMKLSLECPKMQRWPKNRM